MAVTGRTDPVSLNAQASLSPATFDADIVEPGAVRVLAMSPFGYGHDPDGAAAPANAWVAGGGLLPPHAAATRATAATTTTTIAGAPSLARGPAGPLGFARVLLTAPGWPGRGWFCSCESPSLVDFPYLLRRHGWSKLIAAPASGPESGAPVGCRWVCVSERTALVSLLPDRSVYMSVVVLSALFCLRLKPRGEMSAMSMVMTTQPRPLPQPGAALAGARRGRARAAVAAVALILGLMALLVLQAGRANADGSLLYSAWTPLGGVAQGAPALTHWTGGRLDTFVRGSDNNLWHKWDNGTWSPWENLGAPPAA